MTGRCLLSEYSMDSRNFQRGRRRGRGRGHRHFHSHQNDDYRDDDRQNEAGILYYK